MTDHIPFGKHSGVLFKDIPLPYLRWFCKWYGTEADDPDEDLLQSVQKELKRRDNPQPRQERKREQQKPPRTERIPIGVHPRIALELVSEGRRALARKYHPDVPFGDLESMKQVNATADWLTDVCRVALPTGGPV